MQPNKALQLTRRHRSACQGSEEAVVQQAKVKALRQLVEGTRQHITALAR